MRSGPWIVGFLFASGLALAQPGESVRVEYQADVRCPSLETFVAEVHARSPRVSVSSDGTRALTVRIETRGTKTHGHLELREADGTTTSREVSGASCGEVVSGLALVAALALDPTASPTPTPTPTPSPTLSPSPSPSPTPSPSPSPSPTSTPTSMGALEPGKGNAWAFGAGLDAVAVVGVAPDVVFAAPVFFDVTHAIGTHVAIGAGVRFVRTGETSLTNGVGGDFTWTVGALDLCPFQWFAERVRLRTCLRAHAGTLEAHGVGVTPLRSDTRPWLDLGVALTFRVRAAGPLFFEAAAAAFVPLVRDEFFLEPNSTIFQPPVLGVQVGGGAGVEIW